MTDSDFQKWANLVHSIVHKRFRWGYRQFGEEDLKSEGYEALVEAWSSFDPDHPSGANFTTYAYSVISRSLCRYINSCKPHVLATDTAGGDNIFDLHALPSNTVVHNDYIAVCLEKLRNRMDPEDLNILMQKYGYGRSSEDIARDLGCSGENVRKTLNGLRTRAFACILEETDD